ncbi:diphthamide biosynthesis protein 4 [Purpureocillium lavendulum]|uniref:Diphthamide biosynthesis protein 4 n=1 Tax=Purpureocillium lavendulum TaxID=1247861 RepID=A0AB34G567_9HYPO|nr:diphthamide biosynthesis protein 4 [Purpureocillium lavendulum]
MDSPGAGSPAASSATHYEVLGLTSSILDSSTSDPSALIKRAYHRALLRNHPDKAAPSSIPTPNTSTFTVDQISRAFTVLSSPAQRAKYDSSLRLSQSAVPGAARFQTGVENVDLDDLPFDEGEERWYRSCRCGNDRGYSFGEEDLLGAGDEGLLMVGCQDCSLWLRVHFAVVEDEPDQPSNANG